ncbi:ComEC family competence protein [Planococcus massiliensis]|uniref:ComEC family competence protein n=2 Tax=Planococcus massiliensis TaxID=1499687 RepID=A0A098EMJ6_9BACL|nr:ComEC family competence protein [Planococcus massiliensis]
MAATYAAHESPRMLGFMALLFLWMAWKREPLLFMALIGVAACSFFALQEIRQQEEAQSGSKFTGELLFLANYTIDGDGLRGFAKLDGKELVYAKYRFESAEEKALYENSLFKSTLQVSGAFEEPSEPSHRFAFDMKKYLKHNGAKGLLKIEAIHAIAENRTFNSWMSSRRESLKTHIRESFPAGISVEAEALLIGEQDRMSPEDRQLFQTLGITHLFAISGLHVAIIAGIAYFLLIRLHFRKESVVLWMLAILPLYALLAGGAPSIWRSVCMVCIVLAGSLFKLKWPISHVLTASFIFFVLWNPALLYNIGFQLSYGATFAIIYSSRFLSLSASAIKNGLIITAVSQLSLYPLLLHHFYEISLSSFLVNSLFVPLYTAVILPVNLVLLGMTFLWPAGADFLFPIYEPVRSLIAELMEWLARIPHQMWNPGKPEPLMAVLLMASVLIFYVLAEKGFRLWQLLVLIVPAILFTLMPYADNNLKITFLDVGQGDSAVIELPYRKGVYVIDAGGLLRFDQETFQEREKPYEIGRQIVVPYLKGKGISAVDILVLSHADADHAEGADELFKLLSIKQLHLTPGSAETDLMQALAPYAQEASAAFPYAGSSWRSGNINFTYLSPADSLYEGNNDSLVLLLESEEMRILFTGDLEAEGERELLEKYGEKIANLTLLKVGHHGSKTSSSEPFLEMVNPALSIFSTGKDNRYGHPADEVVQRFEDLGLKTINTAERGTLEFSWDQGEMRLEAMRPIKKGSSP